MSTENCKHSFEPRYSLIFSTDLKDSLDNSGISNISYEISTKKPHTYLKEKIYIHDICIKCGKVIE